MTTVSTVTGATDSANLGRVLMHEHVLSVGAEIAAYAPELAWGGTPDARVAAAVETLRALKARGIDTVVDMTVLGLGRPMTELLAVAEQVDVSIVLVTGVYPRHQLPAPIDLRRPTRSPDGRLADVLADLFVRDIRRGIAGTGVRAGMVKGYTDLPGITPTVDRCLRAAAFAHRETGVPITTHAEHSTHSGLEQLRVFAEEGVDLTRVVIGHAGDTADVTYLRRLMDSGATIGSDRFGLYLEQTATFEQRVNVLGDLCSLGYADRIVLGHDAHCYADYDFPGSVWDRDHLPQWVPTHLIDDVLPALAARGVAPEHVQAMLIDNPRRLFEQNTPY
jgi:phosphotriesterase-related protein